MHGRFHKAKSLFNLVSKVQPLECRQGEEKAVLRGTSQKPAFGSLGGKVKESGLIALPGKGATAGRYPPRVSPGSGALFHGVLGQLTAAWES